MCVEFRIACWFLAAPTQSHNGKAGNLLSFPNTILLRNRDTKLATNTERQRYNNNSTLREAESQIQVYFVLFSSSSSSASSSTVDSVGGFSYRVFNLKVNILQRGAWEGGRRNWATRNCISLLREDEKEVRKSLSRTASASASAPGALEKDFDWRRILRLIIQ